MNYHLSINIWVPSEYINSPNYRILQVSIEEFKRDLIQKLNLFEDTIFQEAAYGNETFLEIKKSTKINNTNYTRVGFELSPKNLSLHEAYNKEVPNIKYIHVILPEFRVIESHYKLHRKNTFDTNDPNLEFNCLVPDVYQRNSYIANRWGRGELNTLFSLKRKKLNSKRFAKIDNLRICRKSDDIFYDEEKDKDIVATTEYTINKVNWNSDFYIRIRKEKSWKQLTKNRKQFQHNLN